ncbi:phage tail tape measure protein [Micrococcus terreus]|uniref:phage tail tape measure protein n=1 Tax=Micrococcus terreus TaxID=574650 RepID=UPI00254D22E2|nr:phage tail tape measure protein [Micrococcus terreus]MDK7701486.1 phage tail tape measure protein [Micrococcus terreus]WOO98186.1 phage tail tape measure protein [Micrococcus terreus]
MAQADDAVWLPVLPSMKGFGPALAKGAASDADKVGKDTGARFGKALAIGVTAVGAAGLAAGTALYKVGEVFDDVTDTIRTGTGATGKDLDAMVASAKRVGQNVPAEFSAIGTTIADVNTRMGLSGDVLETVASQYLEAGRILGEDVDITKTSAAFNAFKIEGEDVVGAMDHLFQVSQATGVGMNDLASNVSRNAPALQTLGFSFEEATAMVGSFDKAGINSGQVMAAMSKGLVTLAKDGEKPQEAFQRVVGEIDGYISKGDEAGALNLASKVFGTRGATQFIGALKAGTLNLDDMSKAAGQTGDTILGVGEDTADFAEEWQKFKNNVLVWLEPMGAAVFGALGTVMGQVTEGVKLFGAAWEANDGKITSSGLPGLFERLGHSSRQTFDYIKANVVPTLQNLWTWVMENKGALLSLIPAVAAGAAVFGAYFAITKAMATYSAIVGWFKATTLAQQGLNAAMRANPIGLVVAALAALVAAGIWAYNNVTWFRDGVNTAWRMISSAVSFAWTRVIQPVFRAFSDFVTKVLGPAISWFWSRVVQPVFGWVGDRISGIWNGVVKPVMTLMRDIFVKIVGPAINDWWTNTVRPVFRAVGGWISDTWKKHIQPILAAFGAYFDKHLSPKIRAGVEVIGRIWSGLKKSFADPINWVITNVWNNGIIRAFNSVADAVGSNAKLGRIGIIGTGDSTKRGNSKGVGGVTTVGMRAKGGPVRPGQPYIVGEEGPELIWPNQPGWVSTAAQTAKVLAAGQDMPLSLSQAAAGRRPSEAMLPMGGNIITDGLGAIGKGLSWVVGELAKGARGLLDPMLNLATRTLSGFGLAGQMAGSTVKKAADLIFGWAGGEDKKGAEGGFFGGDYDGPRSGLVRPAGGPITSWFGKRWGSIHSGIDFAVPIGSAIRAAWSGVVQRAAWNALAGHTGKGMVLGHGGGKGSYYGHLSQWLKAPGSKVKAGEVIALSGNTGRSTGPHLHWGALQNGRPVNANALFRDNGGSVPHGLNLVWNDTGRDELMLNHKDAMATAEALRAPQIPGTMIVRIGEREFVGYVEDIGDARLAHHVGGAVQVRRQFAGA